MCGEIPMSGFKKHVLGLFPLAAVTLALLWYQPIYEAAAFSEYNESPESESPTNESPWNEGVKEAPLTCASNQFRANDGKCKDLKKCTKGKVNGVDGECYNIKCPRGQVRDVNIASCVQRPCTDGKTLDANGKCTKPKTKKIPKTSRQTK